MNLRKLFFLKNKKLFLGILLITGTFVSILLLNFETNEILATPDIYDLQGWETYIAAVGPETAYEDFKAAAREKGEFQTQHDQAHFFGNVLFAVTGKDSIDDCDFKYGAGCIHEFYTNTAKEEGLEATEAIHEVCVEKAQNQRELGLCYHFVGNTSIRMVDLETTLNTCREVEEPYDMECADGAYTVLFTSVKKTEYLGHPEKLLTHLPDCQDEEIRFTRICQSRIIQGFASLSMNAHNSFEKLLSEAKLICKGMDDDYLRNYCHHSLGKFVITSFGDFSIEAIKVNCQSQATEEEYQWCIGGATWRLADAEYYDFPIDSSALCKEITIPTVDSRGCGEVI